MKIKLDLDNENDVKDIVRGYLEYKGIKYKNVDIRTDTVKDDIYIEVDE